MARPIVNPLQWRQLYQTVSPAALTPRYHGAQACTPRAVTHNSNTSLSKRTFHTTQTRSAIRPSSRSSAVRRSKNFAAPDMWSLDGGLRLDRDGFFHYIISQDINETLATFSNLKVFIYETAGPMMPPGVNLATFEDVCTQLIILSHSTSPTASLVRHISVDVDAVYRISLNLARLPDVGPVIHEWALSACAKAKSRRALVRLVNRYLGIKGVDIHRNTEWIAQVKDLALVDEFPQAIMLYAKLLLWRGEHAAAAELLEQKIIPYIKATRIRPAPFEDLTLGYTVDSPLRMYGLALAETQGTEAAKSAMRRAALEFGEPIALTELAIIQLESDNWDLYEQYMSMAATSAYGPACLYLANFYYRISQGQIPTQEERSRKIEEEKSATRPWNRLSGPLFEWFDKKINKPMDRETYRKLSIEWYALAFELGENEAGFILALLFREDGQMELSHTMYDKVMEKGLPSSVSKKGLLEMENKWDDPTFNPGLPPKLLKIS